MSREGEELIDFKEYPLPMPPIKVPRNPWLTAAFGLSIATLVICVLGTFKALFLFLLSHGAISEGIEMGLDYWVMLSDGTGTGVDVAIVEKLFGEYPGIPKGLLITLVNAAISFLWFASSSIPLIIAILILIRLDHDHSSALPNRLWIIGVVTSLLTMQLIAAALFLLVAFASAKGRHIASRRILRGCAAIGVAALCCWGICMAYVIYANSEVEGLMGNVEQVTRRQTPVDITKESGPDIHFAPDFNKAGDQISTVTVTHGLPILVGDSGTMMMYIEETYDKSKADLTDQHDFLRLWLKKVDGEWEIADYYWHL